MSGKGSKRKAAREEEDCEDGGRKSAKPVGRTTRASRGDDDDGDDDAPSPPAQKPRSNKGACRRFVCVRFRPPLSLTPAHWCQAGKAKVGEGGGGEANAKPRSTKGA